MKYMGSKRAMLRNGLGELLEREVPMANRFVDLFAGSAAVSIHVAQRFDIPVIAFDLQRYSVVLADAVIGRRTKLRADRIWTAWRGRAQTQIFQIGKIPDFPKELTHGSVSILRRWCSGQVGLPITRAYGGHYFSPVQAVWIDAFRATLPRSPATRSTALAALIDAVSECAAGPGHTAQPFQPTPSAKRFLEEAWRRDVIQRTRQALVEFAELTARQLGHAEVANANESAKNLQTGDLVFIDPPYSGVHYSRFYHVLESVARGRCGPVSGIGRYPIASRRPRSQYSLKSDSALALDELLCIVASRGARAILTFPDHHCSNGLSGDAVREIAARYFRVEERIIASRFSTLGGPSADPETKFKRAARRDASELMLLLKRAKV